MQQKVLPVILIMLTKEMQPVLQLCQEVSVTLMQLMFGSIGNFAIWWSASEDSPTTAWDRGVDYSTAVWAVLMSIRVPGFQFGA